MANDRFCCFRVHTIGMILGWLGSISAVISIVVMGFLLGYLDRIVAEVVKRDPAHYDYDSVRGVLLGIMVAGLVLTTIHLVASILLIVGTVKNKHLLVLPWLVNSTFGILYLIAVSIITISQQEFNSFGQFLTLMMPLLISLAIQLTLWFAIYKLFRNIREQLGSENQRLLQGATAPTYTRL